MPHLASEQLADWTLLRVKPNDSGAGTFADDTDWAGTNATPPFDERISITAQQSSSSSRTAKLSIIVVAVDAADSAVNRATFTFSVDVIEALQTNGNEVQFGGSPVFTSDSDTLASIPANRKVETEIEKGNYTVRLHTFANIPAAAFELRVYVKVS